MKLADLLKKHNLKIAFAESCTAGLCSAIVAETPGMSKHLMGSLVTYQPEVKVAILEVSPQTLEKHTPESDATAYEMACGLTKHFPDADYCVSVVGHTEPDLPNVGDFPRIWVRIYSSERYINASLFAPLQAGTRVERQHEAAQHVVDFVARCIKQEISDDEFGSWP